MTNRVVVKMWATEFITVYYLLIVLITGGKLYLAELHKGQFYNYCYIIFYFGQISIYIIFNVKLLEKVPENWFSREADEFENAK